MRTKKEIIVDILQKKDIRNTEEWWSLSSSVRTTAARWLDEQKGEDRISLRSYALCLDLKQFKIHAVSRFRDKPEFKLIPEKLQTIAHRFLGKGRKDNEGITEIASWLDRHFPQD